MYDDDFPAPWYFNTGACYHPVSNSWNTVSLTGAPDRRANHTAVWTGTEMIIWGGVHYDSNVVPTYWNTGARYNPARNTWTSVTSSGAPVARSQHTAVWTGSEMIVWGGLNGRGNLNDGGRYSPAADSWLPVGSTDSLAARHSHTAVWTGSEMMVWGGWNGWNDGIHFGDGSRYNPAENAWRPMSPVGAPGARQMHTAVWTGNEMVVWGGYTVDSTFHFLKSGARYNPAGNLWTTVNPAAPMETGLSHTAVWTGREMIICVGFHVTRYDPQGDSWTAVSSAGAAAGRYNHTTVWTGTEMILWGGWNHLGNDRRDYKDGGRYDPAGNSWAAVNTTAAPAPRSPHGSVDRQRDDDLGRPSARYHLEPVPRPRRP